MSLDGDLVEYQVMCSGLSFFFGGLFFGLSGKEIVIGSQSPLPIFKRYESFPQIVLIQIRFIKTF